MKEIRGQTAPGHSLGYPDHARGLRPHPRGAGSPRTWARRGPPNQTTKTWWFSFTLPSWVTLGGTAPGPETPPGWVTLPTGTRAPAGKAPHVHAGTEPKTSPGSAAGAPLPRLLHGQSLTRRGSVLLRKQAQNKPEAPASSQEVFPRQEWSFFLREAKSERFILPLPFLFLNPALGARRTNGEIIVGFCTGRRERWEQNGGWKSGCPPPRTPPCHRSQAGSLPPALPRVSSIPTQPSFHAATSRRAGAEALASSNCLFIY